MDPMDARDAIFGKRQSTKREKKEKEKREKGASNLVPRIYNSVAYIKHPRICRLFGSAIKIIILILYIYIRI